MIWCMRKPKEDEQGMETKQDRLTVGIWIVGMIVVCLAAAWGLELLELRSPPSSAAAKSCEMVVTE